MNNYCNLDWLQLHPIWDICDIGLPIGTTCKMAWYITSWRAAKLVVAHDYKSPLLGKKRYGYDAATLSVSGLWRVSGRVILHKEVTILEGMSQDILDTSCSHSHLSAGNPFVVADPETFHLRMWVDCIIVSLLFKKSTSLIYLTLMKDTYISTCAIVVP